MKTNLERFIKNEKLDILKNKGNQMTKLRLPTPTKTCRCNFSWLRFCEVLFGCIPFLSILDFFLINSWLNIEFWYFFLYLINDSFTKKTKFFWFTKINAEGEQNFVLRNALQRHSTLFSLSEFSVIICIFLLSFHILNVKY